MSAAVFNKTGIGLGAFVRDQYGRLGRVYKLNLWEGPGESSAWVAGQTIPVTDEQREEPWASILVDGGGAVVQPISTLIEVPPFTLDNPYADEYFKDAA